MDSAQLASTLNLAVRYWRTKQAIDANQAALYGALAGAGGGVALTAMQKKRRWADYLKNVLAGGALGGGLGYAGGSLFNAPTAGADSKKPADKSKAVVKDVPAKTQSAPAPANVRGTANTSTDQKSSLPENYTAPAAAVGVAGGAAGGDIAARINSENVVKREAARRAARNAELAAQERNGIHIDLSNAQRIQAEDQAAKAQAAIPKRERIVKRYGPASSGAVSETAKKYGPARNTNAIINEIEDMVRAELGMKAVSRGVNTTFLRTPPGGVAKLPVIKSVAAAPPRLNREPVGGTPRLAPFVEAAEKVLEKPMVRMPPMGKRLRFAGAGAAGLGALGAGLGAWMSPSAPKNINPADTQSAIAEHQAKGIVQ